MALPFFFIKKKDGGLCPVQDYQKLNEMTIKNKYPLPLIQELINKVKHSKVFTKFDVRWGYNNIRIKEGDEWKAAFKTNQGLFELTVMFFGLINSPATFQTFMNHIFRDLVNEGHVIVYIDDILVFTKDVETHHRVIKRVLEVLREHKLYLKLSKYFFKVPEVEYLGCIVGRGMVQMDLKKVEAVKGWPIPKTKKQLQSFLRFCNYYHRFIQDFSKHAKPLTHLMGNVEFVWTDEQQKAFESIRNKICKEPILHIPQSEGKFHVEANSSEFANGGILSQFVNGQW
ncbi:hypothetical protein AX16_010366 [Volvariella volvacea WC 439]|nr:hypothetical protein AX16_010366 [Volvariella volvacea WC 439]